MATARCRLTLYSRLLLWRSTLRPRARQPLFFLQSQMSSADRAAAVGDAISGIATNGYVEARMGLTKPQTNMLDGPSGFGGFSGVSTVIGMANNALEVNGGWQNTIQGFTNGFSNISWLLHDASPDQVLGFATDANAKVTAVISNAVLSPLESGLSAITGRPYEITGNTVQEVGSFFSTGISKAEDVFNVQLWPGGP